MKSEKIVNAIESVEPEVGAKERIYNKTLEKAAKKREKIVKIKRALRYALPSAACVAVIAVAAVAVVYNSVTSPLYEGESYYETVSSADDFKELGIYFSLPDGAENAEYYIIGGNIARAVFSVNGAEYTVSASEQNGDFSGVTDESVGSETIDSESGAVLETLESGEYKARWSDGKITYHITASGDVEKDDFLSVAWEIIASTR